MMFNSNYIFNHLIFCKDMDFYPYHISGFMNILLSLNYDVMDIFVLKVNSYFKK